MSYNSKYTGAEVEEILDSVGGKVDKVEGKQLSTEDFTTALKQRLEGLSNYDDTEISQAIEKLRSDFDTLVSGDTTSAIKTFNEIVAFLDGIEDSDSLDSIIASIEQQIAGKGTVKSITAGAGLTGGTITEEGTIGLKDLRMSGSFVEPLIGVDIANSNLDTNLIYKTKEEGRYTYEIDPYGRIVAKWWGTVAKPTVQFEVATTSKKGLMSAEDKVKLDGKQDKIQIIDHGTDDTTLEIAPNVLHKWGTVTSLALTLATPEDDSVANYYMIEFTSGTTATSLSLPDTITWANDLNIEAGKTYQISILNNLGVIGGF